VNIVQELVNIKAKPEGVPHRIFLSQTIDQNLHEFDWDNVKILDKEMNYNKRLISEMIFIKKQKHDLNA